MSKSDIIDLNLLVEIGLYQAFVEPFVDVGRVAKLTAKRLANPLATFISLLNPFGDEDWVMERMNGFERRRDEFARDWKQLNKDINDKLGPDARLVMFFANPAGYLAANTTAAAASTAGDVLLDATGLGQFIAAKIGAPYEALASAAEAMNNPFAAGGREPAALAGIEKQLSRLFFKESTVRNGAVLREQEEPPPQISTKDLTNRLRLELDILDANTKLNALFEEWYQETESLISDLEERVGQKRKLAEQFVQIDSIKSFEAFLQQAVAANLIETPAVKKILDSIAQQVKQLATDQEFVAKAEELGKEPQKIADDTVLAATLEEIKPQMSGIVKDIDTIAAEIADSIPTMQQLNNLPANKNTALLKNLRARLRQISSAVK